MEDVPEVHRRPHDPERPVVRLDETSRQPVGEVRGPLPPGPGETARYDGECGRTGTADVPLAFEPSAGWRQVRVTDRRRRRDRAAFVEDLADGPYAGAARTAPVMARPDTHTPASPYEAFPPEEAKRPADRLEIHRTPEHGSWLTMAGIELGALARHLPERVGDGAASERHVTAREHRRNAARAEADRRFTTADARVKLRKLHPSSQA